MKIVVVLLGIIFCSSNLLAEEVNTSLFKIFIPSDMSVEWNKTDTILVTPVDKKLKLPFLQIDYVSASHMFNRFEMEYEKIKKLFQDIQYKEYGNYHITTGDRVDTLENRTIYGYLAIIRGPNVGVIMTYLTYDKQYNAHAQFNEFVNQIIESNRAINQFNSKRSTR